MKMSDDCNRFDVCQITDRTFARNENVVFELCTLLHGYEFSYLECSRGIYFSVLLHVKQEGQLYSVSFSCLWQRGVFEELSPGLYLYAAVVLLITICLSVFNNKQELACLTKSRLSTCMGERSYLFILYT